MSYAEKQEEEIRISETVVIKIPGLSASKTFLHISDAHIVKAYPCDSDAEKEAVLQSVERWNDEGISAEETFIKFLTFAEERKPDAVLMAGDMIDYYTKSNVMYLKELLSGFSIEYLYAWGNHEHGTYGLEIPDITTIRDDISPLMRNATQFYVRDFEGFLLVCLDNSNFDITDEQMEKMKAVIADGRPILLMMHVPVWTEAFAEVAWSIFEQNNTENACAFSELIRREDSHVAAIIAGHEHFDWSGEFAPGRMQYVSAPCFKRYVREIRVMPL